MYACKINGSWTFPPRSYPSWVSFFRLLVLSRSSCKCPCLFRFVVFKYFHLYDVSYFMLIREFVNMLFSVTVFNNVSCQVYSIFDERKFVLVKFEYE